MWGYDTGGGVEKAYNVPKAAPTSKKGGFETVAGLVSPPMMIANLLGGGDDEGGGPDVAGLKKPDDAPAPVFGDKPTTTYENTPFTRRLDDIMGSLSETAGEYNQLNRSLISKQKRFGSPAYAAEQIASAKHDVGNAFAKQRAEAEMRDASLGLDPGNPRAAASRRLMNISEAGATAGAGTMARKGAEMQDWTTGMQLAGQGNALTGQTLQAGQIGGNQFMEGQGLGSRQLMNANEILTRLYMQGRDINSKEFQQLRDLAYRQNKDDAQAEADSDSGLGSLIGTGLGVAASFF
jgi:hypothetical protein